jgi:hypothetical protein
LKQHDRDVREEGVQEGVREGIGEEEKKTGMG